MRYETPTALRMALEDRFRLQAKGTGIPVDRLRRRVMFERIIARLEHSEPGLWVLKGGMALEVRLLDDARLTKDMDLGFRDDVASGEALHERLVEVLRTDPHGDRFVLQASQPLQLGEDGGGHLTWRLMVSASLADRSFGKIQLDVSPRTHELSATDRVVVQNSLEFAGVPSTTAEIIDVDRHAAEKFHGMIRDFGDRDNSRVRDLVDLVILIEHELLHTHELRVHINSVWSERNNETPPSVLPALPETWPARYERLASEHELSASSFEEAVRIVRQLWSDANEAQRGSP